MSSVHKNYLFTSESVTEGHPDKIAGGLMDWQDAGYPLEGSLAQA